MQDGDIISRAQSSSGAGAKKEMRDVRTFTALITLGEDKLRRELLRRGLSGAGSRLQMAKRLWPVLAAESMRRREVCAATSADDGKGELARFEESALVHELARRGVTCDAELGRQKDKQQALAKRLRPLLIEEHARGAREEM